jgi:hypothetical protein
MSHRRSDEEVVSSPPGQSSDQELVRRLVKGDERAMEVLFDRYYRTVMRVALRIVRDPGEAQDVVQVVSAAVGTKVAARLYMSIGRSHVGRGLTTQLIRAMLSIVRMIDVCERQPLMKVS